MNLFNLIGKLVLDTSDYDKGIENAKAQNQEFVENTGASTVAAAAKWTLVVAAVAKVVSAIKGLVVDSTEYADRIKNLAQIYGYTTQEIQEMNSVAEQSGKDLERVLRGIRTNGQTAAEYLGLSAEEYKAMVDEAYRFGTILGEDSLNKVDALGDRVAYLKAEWTAAITALLAGESGSEEAVTAFFENLGAAVEDYAPTIVRFVVNLLITVAKSVLKIAPQIVEDFIGVVIDEIYSINWFEVGVKIIGAILKGVWRGLGKLGRRVFGVTENDRPIEEDNGSYAANISANDYEVTENVTQKIDVNLKFEGDTPMSENNAEVVGKVVAQQIDEILGRRLNG